MELSGVMVRASNKPLKQNPFQTIRDPETGQWMVVYSERSAEQEDSEALASDSSSHAVTSYLSNVA